MANKMANIPNTKDAYKFVFNKSLEKTSEFIETQIDDEGTCLAIYNILQGKLKTNRNSAIDEVMVKVKPMEEKMNAREVKPVETGNATAWRPNCQASDHLENYVKNCVEQANDENIDPRVGKGLMKQLDGRL